MQKLGKEKKSDKAGEIQQGEASYQNNGTAFITAACFIIKIAARQSNDMYIDCETNQNANFFIKKKSTNREGGIRC